MANGNNDDGSSAPTRIREVRPAGKPDAMREAAEPKPMQSPTPMQSSTPAPTPTPMQADIGAGASGATQIRGYSGMAQGQMSEKDTGGFDPVVGWLVVVAGPGRGNAVNIKAGMNSVGRNANQRISLNFGDPAISAEGAAFITFEPKRGTFHINHGGKANIVYLNEEAVLTPMLMAAGNMVSIGETKLRFVPLCGPEFNWDEMK
ncbi:MAG TPA: FHA domain-containing protein [Xanthobacteraceae bacterium]|nr:FHA domain-containing protein [Xanthobacteraceae bacterium]